jgi:hypothetical protein
MIRKDYHGFTLEQAMQDLHELVGYVRGGAGWAFGGTISTDAEFIVGHGVIRTELLNLLRTYGLSPTIQLGNNGVILCTIE